MSNALQVLNRKAARLPQRASAAAIRALRRAGVYGQAEDFVNNIRPPMWPGMRLTPKRLLNYQLVQYQRSHGHTKLFGRPLVLTLEATNVCNLKCPACFTGVGEVTRVRGIMPMERYRSLIDELGDYALLLEFYNWGEPLLNKNIYEMVGLASGRGISTIISTNFSVTFDQERAEKLVNSGLAILGAGIDGASQETYEQYRAGGDFEKTLKNMRLMVAAKKALGSESPIVCWSFHAFEHNKHEIDKAKSMADDIGVEFSATKGWVEGDEWDDEGKVEFPVMVSPERCRYLWTQAVVNNDGLASPCANSFFEEEDFGTVDEGGFMEVWNNRYYQEARKTFSQRNGSEFGKSLICNDCPYTKTWENFESHLAQGLSKNSFESGYTTNDWFNYFFQRRHDRDNPAQPENAIDLSSVDSPSS